MNITLLMTTSNEYSPIIKLSAPNALEYCLQWRLQFELRRHSRLTKSIAIDRLKFMKEALYNTDWLFFCGADTLIMNHKIDVRTFLDNDCDLIIGYDINGINNDVFFLKSTEASFNFLALSLFHMNDCANDQEAMWKAMTSMSGLRVKRVHQKLFNSYLYSEYNYPDDGGGSFTYGDFLLHLPGLPNSRRVEIMTEYLERIRK